MTVKEFSEFISVPVRTIQGWCSGRPIPAWVDVFIRRLEFSQTLGSRFNFLERFTKNTMNKLLNLRNEFQDSTSFELRKSILDQIGLLICFWFETYPQDDIFYCNHTLNEFQSIRDSCQL